MPAAGRKPAPPCPRDGQRAHVTPRGTVMSHRKSLVAVVALLLIAPFVTAQESPRWDAKRANDWYAKQPWLVGCNFIPSTAINQLEMWQADTFDPAAIDRELGWAADKLGFNTARVFLHDLAYHADP